MGRERRRKMEHLLLYVACSLIILTCGLGCSHISPQRHTQGVLKSAAVLAEEGDITKALQRNEMAMMNYHCYLCDQALFQRGVLLSHPDNPKQNYKEAARVFKKLKTDYPNSNLKFEAEVWLEALERLLQKNQKIAELKKTIKNQIKVTAQLKERHASQQLQKERHATATQQLQIENLLNQISQLEGQIDKLKKVDLGIELKKRKTVSQ
jgi:hypothetical protein